jgi:type III pantothenate kinase
VGAVIAPGIEGAAGALHTSTAQLPLVSLHNPERVIGRSTVKAIQSGIMVGYQGLVMRILQLMKAELEPAGADVGVLGSGDEAGRSVLASCGIERFIPELALEGLWIIASLNMAPRNP